MKRTVRSNETHEEIAKIEKEIDSLPKGSISKKQIKGKTYFYHRERNGNKVTEKYVSFENVDSLRQKILLRRNLENYLDEMKVTITEQEKNSIKNLGDSFYSNVIFNEDLKDFASSASKYRKRECYKKLHEYIHSQNNERVLILYGLRRTGKSTLIRQAILEMNEDELYKTAYIQLTVKDNLAELNKDLRLLKKLGFKNVFLDEVTLMPDFIEGAALFSDIFVMMGMKVILSGTDSLGFLFAEDEQLYDRCIFIHTTHIPYREFENVLGIKGVDEYIRYGGVMSLTGRRYNENSVFSSEKNVDEYIDVSIAKNIQHSLCHYQYGGHFLGLTKLYEEDELTNAINRVVKDINHNFTIEVITKEFKSNDLALSSRNLRNDKFSPNDVLDKVDVKLITEKLKSLLDIKEKSEQVIDITEGHCAQIKAYLLLLDLINEVDVINAANLNDIAKRIVIAQPGLRYAQANALIESLLIDETFKAIPLIERKMILERIRSEIKGRMLEDIVLLETKASLPKSKVFVLKFPIGEFDMVIYNQDESNCEIFEIKHSKEAVSEQCRNLIDEDKCAFVRHRYGTIKSKIVLYRGESKEINGIRYKNVEEYLNELKIN